MVSEAPSGGIGYVLRKFPVLSETFVLNELLALEAHGVPLHIFSLQRPNDPRFHEDLPRLKARVTYVPDVLDCSKLVRHTRRMLRFRRGSTTRTIRYVLGRRHPALLWRLLQAGYVASEARRLRLRHLHAQFANCPATVASLASMMTGIPYSFTAHAMDIFKDQVNPRGLAHKIEQASFVVTVSEYNKEFLRRIAPRSAGKIIKIHNGIDVERFSASTGNGNPVAHDGNGNGAAHLDCKGNGNGDPEALGGFHILCVARLVEKKGIADLIDACGRLRDGGHAFRCSIVGKGRLRPALEAQIRRLDLTGRVSLLGPKTQLEVLSLYQAADVYVLPCVIGPDGNREGLPVSIVEALSCGLPVVTTPVTGIPEVVEDKCNGILVPCGDPTALAAALASLIQDRDLYRRLRGNARESVAARFDRRRTSAELHDLLAGVAG